MCPTAWAAASRRLAKEKHALPDKSLETVKDTVYEQWEQEQNAEREKTPAPDASKERQRQPFEPYQNR